MMNRNKGFTLVEILIVVIILGILAAIVIPQFTEASEDARNSALSSDLQTLRSQLELYKFQHNDKYPWDVLTTPATDNTTFWTQMMSKTTPDGSTTSGTFGPYVQSKPANPFVSGTAGQEVTIGVVANPGTSGKGWYIDNVGDKISAGDSVHSGF